MAMQVIISATSNEILKRKAETGKNAFLWVSDRGWAILWDRKPLDVCADQGGGIAWWQFGQKTVDELTYSDEVDQFN